MLNEAFLQSPNNANKSGGLHTGYFFFFWGGGPGAEIGPNAQWNLGDFFPNNPNLQ